MAKKYGLRIGKKLVVLDAATNKEAVKEINELFAGPLEIYRTDYQQAAVGAKMVSAKVEFDLPREGLILLKGEFEEIPSVQIHESKVF